MKKKPLLCSLIGILLLISHVTAIAATDTLHRKGIASVDSVKTQPYGAPVAPFGDTLFTIHCRIGPFTPQERAKAAAQKVSDIARDPFFRQDSINIIKGDETFDIVYGELVITSISEADAKAERSTMEDIARVRETKIIYAIQQHRKSTSLTEILKNAAFSVGLIVLLIILITLINKLFRLLSQRMALWQEIIMKRLHLKEYAFFNRQRQLSILLVMLKMLRWLLILVMFMAMLLSIFYLLPWTKAFSVSILGFVLNPLKNILVSIWDYVPNLITIIVILIVSRLIIRLFKFIKSEIEKETLKIPGFYPDWALPTFNIFRVLIIIFTIVAIWPYLPGSGSQVFQGVSVFFGLVFSLTSASALSNFMAGLTITYTRAFKMGDRVKIGEVTGDIIEKSMLVTKIRTIKNEEITVPNNKIMNSEVINYSTCAPDLGLIIHTTVTIGYDAPWRQVHELLIDAALHTELLLKQPKPFVLQTALNDFYISYQINAYTRSPNKLAGIFSHLHQNIQDAFNKAGVEIMSPHYKAIRDGNTIAVPEENRAEDYTPPSFRVEKK